MVVAALRARAAGLSSQEAKRKVLKLAERIGEGTRGNPHWILGA